MDTNICFIVDTGSDFTEVPENVIKVPLHFMFGEKSFIDETISDMEFERMKALEWPKTSEPSPGEFKVAFEKAIEKGYDQILCLPVSAGLSGTYNSALTALDLVDHKSAQIEVVNTRLITLGIGHLVETLIEMLKNSDVAFRELVKVASEFYLHEHIYIALNSLEGLKRGGRIKGMQKKLAGLLQIKPILTLDDEGKLDVLEKIRTFSKTLDRVVEMVMGTPNTKKIGVMYSDNKDIATTFVSKLVLAFQAKGIVLVVSDIPIVRVCKALSTHADKNAVGVCLMT